MNPRRLARGLLAASLFAVTGCASTIDGITQRSTRSSTQVVVDEMTEKQTQQKIANNLDEAALQELSRRVAGNAVDGAIEALEDPDRKRRVEGLLEGVAMPTAISRIDDREVAEAVETALATSMKGIDRGDVRGLVHDVVDEAVRTAFAAAREESRGFDANAEVGAVAREIGKQAAFGFQDAVDETARRRELGLIPDGEGAVLLAAGQAADRYNTWMVFAMVGIGAVAVALIGLVIAFHRRTKVQRAELEQRDEALMVLTEAVQESDGRPWSPELREALSASIRDRARRDEVRRMLREHRESRAPDAPSDASPSQRGRKISQGNGPISRRRLDDERPAQLRF